MCQSENIYSDKHKKHCGNTIEFLGIWENLYNPDFNPIEFEGVRKKAGLNAFTMSRF